MGYYDSVKDSVKDNKDKDLEKGKSAPQKKQASGSGGGFGTLKKAAQEESEDEETQNDDTPIEVLEEGLQERNTSRTSSPTQSSSVETDPGSTQNTPVQSSGLEDKLDKIIEQNAKMIEILESFGE